MVDGNIEQQQAYYDYFERLKREYESILKELQEKYPETRLEDLGKSLEELKGQVVSLDDFIDQAERKAEELLSAHQEVKIELIEKFEEIRELIDKELGPELEQFRVAVLGDKLDWSETTKELVAKQGRLTANKEVEKSLFVIEDKIVKILSPLGELGKVLIRIFQFLLRQAGVRR